MIDVVMITNGKRPELLQQSYQSLIYESSGKNGTDYNVTIVFDGANIDVPSPARVTKISTPKSVGASAARNIGASSIPKYRRGKYIMFLDDDVYMCPGWDKQLFTAADNWILSGHAHPYNHTVLEDHRSYYETNVISTVHMMMPWELWDNVGFFTEPGGSGGSEDVDYCNRAREKRYMLTVTKPHCVIHAGLHGSGGKEIVGYREMQQQNYDLLRHWKLEGKVIFS